MPSAAKRYTQERTGKVVEHRDVSHRKLYDGRWYRYAARFRKANPTCARCRVYGRVSPTQTVDHIIPHRGNEGLFLDEANHCPLCKACHDFVTLAYDGGLGRQRGRKPRYLQGEIDV